MCGEIEAVSTGNGAGELDARPSNNLAAGPMLLTCHPRLSYLVSETKSLGKVGGRVVGAA